MSARPTIENDLEDQTELIVLRALLKNEQRERIAERADAAKELADERKDKAEHKRHMAEMMAMWKGMEQRIIAAMPKMEMPEPPEPKEPDLTPIVKELNSLSKMMAALLMREAQDEYKPAPFDLIHHRGPNNLLERTEVRFIDK